jgi:hypothetical protein
MLAECIWREFLPTFFGPFLKEHYPTSSILKKPKFQVIQKWFSFALEAWSGFCKNIPQLRETIPEINLPHLDSLLDLFETYISCVLWFKKTKNTQDFFLQRKFVYLQLVLLNSLNCGPYVKVKLLNSQLFLNLGFVFAIATIFLLGNKSS